ncbi:putative intracellular protease/amidase [Rhodopirellula rubra]|uniref:Putative intracellular protease/amidase n=1 Tax=Aporhodopirellula rubra TaxID=980271 RepID=A0A7W5H421_9BACT|nr:DJ-1/PfpI family protein [Aporhodopirellula rubra]MBB3204381.1 putative intracellular protease/amidase [Aporhodopirellula rubra]
MQTANAFLVAILLVGFPAPCFAQQSDSWNDLIERVDVNQNTVSGRWQKSDTAISTTAAGAAILSLPFHPKWEYDFRVKFTRNSGVHSIALFFVTDHGQACFEVDAWGQHMAGIQSINGETIQQNSTRRDNQALVNGRTYTALVEVRHDRVRGLLDGNVIAEITLAGKRLTVPRVWEIPDSKSLGVGAYASDTTFHQIEVRTINGGRSLSTPLGSSDQTAASSRTAMTSPREMTPGETSPSETSPSEIASSETSPDASTSSTPGSRPPSSPDQPSPAIPATRRPSSTQKRVLLVIANQDFFYREYIEPRRELERAGITVDVAAGRKTTCRPHGNSGQQGSGNVMPDLAIADADASDYDAIMFSGGWGSSMYQYAFQGSYSNRVYNGDPQTKAAVNRLLSDFIEQDKYVGALCHGVSVLAWARVNGRSLLQGKRVVASPRQSPSGTYNGRRDQPLSRWNAQTNGAQLSPARSIGNPRTSADDVMIDGKILTGEDDNSATLFGATLAKYLTQ